MGGVGRPPQPVALQLLKGQGEGQDSGGRPVKVPPKFKRQAPPKPEGLEEQASQMWDDICDALESLDILKEIDGPALLVTVETYQRWYDARQMRYERGMTAHNSQGESVAPWVRIEESAGKDFRSWCAEFGLTPSAEMKIAKAGNDGDSESNPFA